MGVVSLKLPVFVSYAHDDNESDDPAQRWLDRLLQMLKPLHTNDEVSAWSDRDLKGGSLLIIPIVIRPCLFAETRFRFPDPVRGPESVSLDIFQSANPPSRPLDSLPRHEQDVVLLNVARRLRAAYEERKPLSR